MKFNLDFNNRIANKDNIIVGSNYRITVLSERLVRLEYSENGTFFDNLSTLVVNRNFPKVNFTKEEDDKYIVITTSYFKLQYAKGKPFIGPKYAPDANLQIKLVNTDKIWYFNHPEARNYLGSAVSLDENSANTKLRKGLYSTDGFTSINDNSLNIESDGYISQSTKRIDTYVFLYRRDFGLCLKDYFTLTGYPAIIPRYALGIWWNRDKIYSDEDLKTLVKTFKRYKIPLSVLLLSEFWHYKDKSDYNKYKTGFTFNKELFKNPKELVDYLHSEFVRVGLNIDPREGIMSHEDNYKAFCEKLNVIDGKTIPFNVLNKDIINLYFEKLITPLNNYGVDFYWLDYYNPKNVLTTEILNYYHKEFSDSDINKRRMILSRNPLTSAHKYPVHYSGETTVGWDTLTYLPTFNASASNIGLSWWSHDVGGFKDGIEDSELYIRYIEFATFSPIFRFSAKRGHYYKREPWSWDIKTQYVVRDYCTLRHRLIPYIYSEGYKYSKTGLPLVQPVYYSYPEIYDEPVYKTEYTFGGELFIAPITHPKDTVMNRAIKKIYLPKGTWYEFKTGKKFPGNIRYITFYKDEDYPVFARSGAIIPLANLEENLNNINPPRSMEIHVFPGKSNIYKLYEDDGYSRLHEQGYYILTSIDYNYMANNYTLIIRPLEGKTGIIPAFRDYTVRFRNTRTADSVTANVNGVDMEVESYEEDADFIVIVKNVDTTKQLTINCKGKDIEIDAVRIINEDIDSIISDLKIKTSLKEELARIIFDDKQELKKKRIAIRKLKNDGLEPIFIKMFLKLLEYVANL